MTRTGSSGFRLMVWPAAIGWVVLCPGCKERDEQPDIIRLEGSVEAIKVTGDGTGEITVSYFSEKQGQNVTGTGLVTAETEIIVNGVLASLSELRGGDRIHGEVRVEKKGKAKVQTVLKIHVDQSAPKPATDDK